MSKLRGKEVDRLEGAREALLDDILEILSGLKAYTVYPPDTCERRDCEYFLDTFPEEVYDTDEVECAIEDIRDVIKRYRDDERREAILRECEK